MPLIHLPVAGGGAAVLVVLVAADLVGRLGAQLDDMEGVKAHLGVGDRLA